MSSKRLKETTKVYKDLKKRMKKNPQLFKAIKKAAVCNLTLQAPTHLVRKVQVLAQVRAVIESAPKRRYQNQLLSRDPSLSCASIWRETWMKISLRLPSTGFSSPAITPVQNSIKVNQTLIFKNAKKRSSIYSINNSKLTMMSSFCKLTSQWESLLTSLSPWKTRTACAINAQAPNLTPISNRLAAIEKRHPLWSLRKTLQLSNPCSTSLK